MFPGKIFIGQKFRPKQPDFRQILNANPLTQHQTKCKWKVFIDKIHVVMNPWIQVLRVHSLIYPTLYFWKMFPDIFTFCIASFLLPLYEHKCLALTWTWTSFKNATKCLNFHQTFLWDVNISWEDFSCLPPEYPTLAST